MNAGAEAARERIAEIALEEPATPISPDLEQERRIAVYDLIEENHFRVEGAAGPYRLRFGADADALRLRVADASGGEALNLDRPLGSVKEFVIDYIALCDDYRDAVRRLAPSQIEKIDHERRALHGEAAAALREALAPAAMDDKTARRLFTLLCALLSGLDAFR